jgi:hypothetical protein
MAEQLAAVMHAQFAALHVHDPLDASAGHVMPPAGPFGLPMYALLRDGHQPQSVRPTTWLQFVAVRQAQSLVDHVHEPVSFVAGHSMPLTGPLAPPM